uniref:Selenoprotein H n=1 Tax=Denticeps clupeoides TaxID=299321 RepID=A0AAY4BND3_9TELE
MVQDRGHVSLWITVHVPAGRGLKRKVEAADGEVAGSVENKWLESGQRVAARPLLLVEVNPGKPRRGSFEVTLMDSGREVCLWSGLKKGPPRKLKFPAPAEMVAELEKALGPK